MNALTSIGNFIRWRDWGPGKLTILMSVCLYIAITYEMSFSQFAPTFLAFLFFAASQSALGYVLNNWGDRELDRRQFKYNAFNGKSRLEGLLAISLVAVIAFGAGLPLALRPGFAVLWLAWVAVAFAYSLEPIRLKTKGLAGLAASFVAQWSLPVLLAFAAFETAGHRDMWLLAAALTVYGATLEISHQRQDRIRDQATRAGTFATTLAHRKMERLYAIFLMLDKLAVGVVVAVVAVALRQIGTDWADSMALALGLVYFILLVASLGGVIRSFRHTITVDPYSVQEPSLEKFLHEALLDFLVPVFLAIAASILSPLYAVILGVFLVWRLALGKADWLWPLHAIKVKLGK